MLIILIALGSAIMTVEAVRVRVLNFLMDVESEYTSFALKDNDKVESTIVDWHKTYAPTFIPTGYEVNAVSIGKYSYVHN